MRFRSLISLALLGGAVTASGAELTVSAAASLSNAFTQIGSAFEAAHPGDKIVFNFAASDVLLKQIEQGAPADVFASADEATMDRAAALIDAATRHDFAGNVLVLIVPAGSAVPHALGDLRTAAYTHIAIGNPDTVPAGRYAKQALQQASLWAPLQAQLVQTQNVRQALDYVARGEAQAGFVYATDAAIQKEKVRVALEVPTSTAVRYPIGALKHSGDATLAREFVAFVMAKPAQDTLQRYGFTAP